MAGPSKLVNGIICDELAFIRHPHTQNYNLESIFSDYFFEYATNISHHLH